MTKLRVLAVASAFAFMPACALADSSGSPVSNIVKPLREIGHVKAQTEFCKAFSAGASPAALAALNFENRLFLTGADLAAFDAGDELAKHRTVRALEDDLRQLADDALTGRTELQALRDKAVAGGTDADQAVIEYADAVSGAQGRQMDIARHFARIVGTLEEVPVKTIVNGALDDHYAGVFSRTGRSRSALVSGTYTGLSTDPDFELNFFTLPGDDAVGRDLARAVERAHNAESLENCL